MKHDEIFQKVCDILKKNMRDNECYLSSDMTLDSLGIESLDFASIVFDIEDEFGIEIPYSSEENITIKTIGDLVWKIKDGNKAQKRLGTLKQQIP